MLGRRAAGARTPHAHVYRRQRVVQLLLLAVDVHHRVARARARDLSARASAATYASVRLSAPRACRQTEHRLVVSESNQRAVHLRRLRREAFQPQEHRQQCCSVNLLWVLAAALCLQRVT